MSPSTMLASRVFSGASRSVYVHCRGSFIFSPSQNQQFQILSKNFHYLCEPPNKLAICKASLLHHAALSSSAFTPTKEQVIEFTEKLRRHLEDTEQNSSSFEEKLQKHIKDTEQKRSSFEEKLLKSSKDSNCSTLAKPEQKSCSASRPTKEEVIEELLKFIEDDLSKKKKSIEDSNCSEVNIPVIVLDPKSQATKSQTLLKGESTKRTTCSNSNSKGKGELSMDDYESNMTDGNYQRHAKLVEDMEKFKKQAERTSTMAQFVIGVPIGFVIGVPVGFFIACMWLS